MVELLSAITVKVNWSRPYRRFEGVFPDQFLLQNRDAPPAVWDDDLKQFVIPYTNYWPPEKNWPIGWHSVLTLKNGTDKPVTYTLKHIPYYGGQFNPKTGRITRYKEQVVQVVLQKGEEKKVTLQDLFGWAPDRMSSMEGCLLINPSPIEAKAATSIRLSVVPNDSGERLHEYKP